MNDNSQNDDDFFGGKYMESDTIHPESPKLKPSNSDTEDFSHVSGSGGLREILSLIDPVWKMTKEELAQMMVKRIIYEDGI